jgi:hypothetical protein
MLSHSAMIIEFTKQFIDDNPDLSRVTLCKLYKLYLSYDSRSLDIDAFKYLISEFFTVTFTTLFIREPVVNYRVKNKHILTHTLFTIDEKQ